MIFLLLLNLQSPPAHALHATCTGNCEPVARQIEKMSGEMKRVQEILKKNEDYLKKNPTASPSIIIKINSNRLMAKLQIETVQNEITATSEILKKQGCQECQQNIAKEN